MNYANVSHVHSTPLLQCFEQVLANHRLKVEQQHSKGGVRPARALQGKRAMGTPPRPLQLLASWGLAVSTATSASHCHVFALPL